VAKFVLDPSAMLEVVGEGVEISPKHQLETANLVRFQTLSMLHEAVARGELNAGEALARHHRILFMPRIRVFGDAVLHRRTWAIADQLGWAKTDDAVYIALARLHKATLVTGDPRIVAAAEGIVPVASVDALR
jgi:predicted nucleic acid-binding protein